MKRGKKKAISSEAEIDNNTEIVMPKKVNLQVKVIKNKLSKKISKTKKEGQVEATVKEPKRQKFVGREIDQERMEKDKRLIMWSGIIFFIVLIIGFWLMNIKSILRINSSSQSKDSNGQINWNSFRDELNKTMVEIKQRLSEINQLQQVNQLSSSTDAQSSLTPDQVNQLKNNLLENVSKEKATTTIK